MLKDGFNEMILFGAPGSIPAGHTSNMSLIDPTIAIRLAQHGYGSGFYKAGNVADYRTYRRLDNLSTNVTKVCKIDPIISYGQMKFKMDKLYKEFISLHGLLSGEDDRRFVAYILYRMYKDYLFPLEEDYPTAPNRNAYVAYEPYFLQDPKKVDYIVKLAEKFEEERRDLVKFESLQVYEALGVETIVENRELSRKVNSYIETLEGIIRRNNLDQAQAMAEARRLLTNSYRSIGAVLGTEDEVSILRKVMRRKSERDVVNNMVFDSIPNIDESYLMNIHKGGKSEGIKYHKLLMNNIKSIITPVVDNGIPIRSGVMNILVGSNEEEIFNSIKIVRGFPDTRFSLRIDLGKLGNWYMRKRQSEINHPASAAAVRSTLYYLGYDLTDIPDTIDISRMGIVIDSAIVKPVPECREYFGELGQFESFNLLELPYNYRDYLLMSAGELRIDLSINSLIFSKYYSLLEEVWDGI